MLNSVLQKVQSTLKEGLNNVKMIVNNLNETRPLISINEKKYYLDDLIAEGGYALIYKIQSVSDEKFFALKKINIQSSNHKKQIKREIKIWKELSKFGNIVELIDFEFTENHAYVVMELCEEGSLLDLVNNHEGNISEVEALLIFNQVLLGVNAMHSQKPPIAHRDLKIENILKKKKNFKICDFGSATDEIFDPTTSDEFVKEQNFQNFEKNSTLYYRAPEMCDRYGEYTVSEKVDIWALGCVLYTMVFKEQPFMNAQKLEIINGNYNFPKDEQKLYSEKFLDLIRVMLTPNPNNRPNILQIMEWTNYWNETEKIPLSPEVEEIKQKQIKSGGLKNKSHKKKLLSAEEIQKIQLKLKDKEKKKKNYDDINELFGFSKNKDEEEQKEEKQKKSNSNYDLFEVFGNNQEKNNNIKQDNNNKNDKDKDDLLDMEFYEVDETQQSNNNKVNTNSNNNTNISNDLNAIFGATSTNSNNPNNNKNENIDLLFNNTNNDSNKSNENNNKTGLDDLFKTLNLESKEKKDTNNSSNTNNSNKGMTFQMNGQDFFSSFPSSESQKKEEAKKPKEEDDLFAAFNPSSTKPKEEKKQQNVQDDLFAAFAQPTTTTKEIKKEDNRKQNIEEDLFAAFSQPNNKQKEEKKEETQKSNLENDLFASFNQPQNKPKEETKKESTNTNSNNNNNILLEGLFSPSPSTQSKEEKSIEPKKENKNNIEFDLFNFNDNNNANNNNSNTNQNKTKNNDFDLLFTLNNNENKENGGEIQKENGQTQQKTSNDNIIPDFSNSNSNRQNNANNNKNQDIFAFFQ